MVGHDGRPGDALELEGAHASEHLDGLPQWLLGVSD
jgi:hypothetical protein